MKKETIIALVISIIYCRLGTLVAYDLFVHFKIENYQPPYPDWLVSVEVPAIFLPNLFSLFLNFFGIILGGIISFSILFYILKTVVNWISYEFSK